MRNGSVRGFAVVGLVAMAALIAGCTEEAVADRGAVGWPPGAAGVACNYLGPDRVDEVLGIRFDTVGGATKDQTYTCALSLAGQDFPDITLSITPTTASDAIFQATVVPAEATIINGPGAVAYRILMPAASRRGPAWEVGWLSERGRMMFLRYTFPPGTEQVEVDTLRTKIVNLAKTIDTALTSQAPR